MKEKAIWTHLGIRVTLPSIFILIVCLSLFALPAGAKASSSTQTSKQSLAPQAQITTPLVFTSSTPSTSGSGYAWDLSSLTLTLNGADINVSSFDTSTNTGSAIILPDGATLKFSGTNSVSTSVATTSLHDIYCAIDGEGSLTVEGAADAHLTATASGATTFGIGTVDSLSLTGGTYTVSAPTESSSAAGSIGLYSAGSLSITNATVDVTGYLYGICANETRGTSTIDNSTITAKALSDSSSAFDILCGGATTMTSSALYPQGVGAQFAKTLTMDNSAIALSLTGNIGINVNKGLTMTASSIETTAKIRPLNVPAGGLQMNGSKIVATSTGGYYTSSIRVGGDADIVDSTLIGIAQGPYSTGVGFIPNASQGAAGKLTVESSRVEASGVMAGLSFTAFVVDPSTEHLALGSTEKVFSGGTLCYATTTAAGVTQSDWAFSDSGSIGFNGTELTGAATSVVIDQAYTVAFDANATDATGSMTTETMPLSSAQTLTANSFARTNWKFAGWNTKADGSGSAYADGASVSGLATAGAEATLYAQWVPADTQTATINGVTATLTGSSKSISELVIQKRDQASTAVTKALGDRTLQSDWDVYFTDGTTEDFGTLALSFPATGKTVQIWQVHAGTLAQGADQSVTKDAVSTSVTELSEFALTAASSEGKTSGNADESASATSQTGDPLTGGILAGLLLAAAAGGAGALIAGKRRRRA